MGCEIVGPLTQLQGHDLMHVAPVEPSRVLLCESFLACEDAMSS